MKHLKNSNLPQSPKRRFSRKVISYLPVLLVASLIGTYLDFIFVGKDLYTFPKRPFPDVLSINIAFTLFLLPFSTWIFLLIIEKMPVWSRLIFILLLSILASIMEKFAEQWGFFSPSNQWNPIYSLIGYFLFLLLMWGFFSWSNVQGNKVPSDED